MVHASPDGQPHCGLTGLQGLWEQLPPLLLVLVLPELEVPLEVEVWPELEVLLEALPPAPPVDGGAAASWRVALLQPPLNVEPVAQAAPRGRPEAREATETRRSKRDRMGTSRGAEAYAASGKGQRLRRVWGGLGDPPRVPHLNRGSA